MYQLRHKLYNVIQGSKTIQAHIDEIKSIADALADANEQLKEDLVYYILQSLLS